MNARRLVFIFFIFVLAAALGAGCGGISPTVEPTAVPPVRLTQPPTFAPTPVPSATATATELAATATPSDPALKAVEDTFAALEEGNYEAAAAMYSNFSLMVDEITRGEAAAALKAQFARGERISGGQVLESRVFDERTHLVHVRYQRGSDKAAAGSSSAAGNTPAAPGATATATQPAAAQEPTATLASGSVDQTRQAEMIAEVTATAAANATPTATAAATATATATATAAANAAATAATPSAEKAPVEVDEWWPVRMESGQWRINRSNLIDFQTLDVPVQTTAGLTVKPRQLTRYTDRMRLTLLVQNQTNNAIVLGQPNEVMATFLFGDQPVEATSQRLIFERLRSYPDTIIEVQGLYEAFPDGIIIRKWKNVQEPPWFEFRFH